MANPHASESDVFSAREIALAAGVDPGDVRTLIASGMIETVDGEFATQADAVAAVRAIRAGTVSSGRPGLFRVAAGGTRRPAVPLAASGAFHALLLVVLVVLATLGVATSERANPPVTHLVFLAAPGPGGGGGGGGLLQPKPPARAELKGTSALRSPVAVAPRVRQRENPAAKPVRPPDTVPVERPAEPPPRERPPDPVPPVTAPVATVAADERDRPGTLDGSSAGESQGPGAGGGSGTGNGTGMGEGTGPGVGPGSGGGTGGGPFRPGAGITPPRIVREIKPDYTEEARRRGLAGDVVLEVIVRSDGRVGNVRLLQGLGAGLDQRAIDAVRQWQFSPALRYGTPVDVLVEVAVEFKLR